MRSLVIALAAACSLANAQSYPSKPVQLVVPFPAGGTVDTVARLYAQKMSEGLKQPFIVEIRAGAGGNIGADMVAKAAPDGHTLLLSIQSLAISAGLYRTLPFDPEKDLAPISQLTGSMQAIVIPAKLPATTLKAFIAAAKAQPGKYNFASSGLGAPNHLYGELLKSSAGIDLVHVPYKGDAPQLNALLTSEVEMSFMPVFSVLPNIRAGKLRALAVTGAARHGDLPDVPTMGEAGIADFNFTGWIGVFAPAKTPRETIERLGRESARVVQLAEVKEPLAKRGYDTFGTSPKEFSARYFGDIAKFKRIIRDAKVPPAN